MGFFIAFNFTTWRNYDFGVYVQTVASVEINNLLSIDNSIGVYSVIYQPTSLDHKFENKFVKILDSTFVGASSALECSPEPPAGPNFEIDPNLRSYRHKYGGHYGITLATFSSYHNGAIFHPMANNMAYFAIRGINILKGAVFNQC